MLDATGAHEAIVTKGSLTFYINMLKSEIVDSAYNRLFTTILTDLRSKTPPISDELALSSTTGKKHSQPPLPFDFIPNSKFKTENKTIKMQPDMFYDLLEIDEEEKIIMHKFIAVRPVAVVSTSMGSVGRIAPLDTPTVEKSSISQKGFNKGHIINAGILYILDSG